MNKYDYALKLVAYGDQYRPIMNKIAMLNDFAYAIHSGSVILKIKAGLTTISEDVIGFPAADKCMGNYPDSPVKTVLVEDLIKCFTCKSVEFNLQTCKKCDGSGEVLCEACEYSHRCEACDGSGDSDKEVQFSRVYATGRELISVGDRSIAPNYINLLILVSSVLGDKVLDYRVNNSGTQIIFIGKEFEFVSVCAKVGKYD